LHHFAIWLKQLGPCSNRSFTDIGCGLRELMRLACDPTTRVSGNLILNSDYSATEVPVPKGVGPVGQVRLTN
jgi:hypothetical protein